MAGPGWGCWALAKTTWTFPWRVAYVALGSSSSRDPWQAACSTPMHTSRRAECCSPPGQWAGRAGSACTSAPRAGLWGPAGRRAVRLAHKVFLARALAELQGPLLVLGPGVEHVLEPAGGGIKRYQAISRGIPWNPMVSCGIWSSPSEELVADKLRSCPRAIAAKGSSTTDAAQASQRPAPGAALAPACSPPAQLPPAQHARGQEHSRHRHSTRRHGVHSALPTHRVIFAFPSWIYSSSGTAWSRRHRSRFCSTHCTMLRAKPCSPLMRSSACTWVARRSRGAVTAVQQVTRSRGPSGMRHGHGAYQGMA